jgi:hypothetical protein
MSGLLAASFRQQDHWRITKRMTVALHVTEDLRAALPLRGVEAILPSNSRGRRGPKHFVWKAERGNHMQTWARQLYRNKR